MFAGIFYSESTVDSFHEPKPQVTRFFKIKWPIRMEWSACTIYLKMKMLTSRHARIPGFTNFLSNRYNGSVGN
jgi:hypothetical protein